MNPNTFFAAPGNSGKNLAMQRLLKNLEDNEIQTQIIDVPGEMIVLDPDSGLQMSANVTTGQAIIDNYENDHQE